MADAPPLSLRLRFWTFWASASAPPPSASRLPIRAYPPPLTVVPPRDGGRKQRHHYPYAKQDFGPSLHASAVTFDCSSQTVEAPVYRKFWHSLKLKSLLDQRLPPPDPSQHAIVLVDRNQCEGCDPSRGVRRQAEIEAEIRRSFPGHELVIFTGKGSFLDQAKAFQRAAMVLAPHGGATSHIIFCRPYTALVEYIAQERRNSLLYAGHARILTMTYWAVISPGPSYDLLDPTDVRETALLAMREHRLGQSTPDLGQSTPARRAWIRTHAYSVALDSDFLVFPDQEAGETREQREVE